jgi:DNA-directed RNA polymerase specialized sigma24 family protein
MTDEQSRDGQPFPPTQWSLIDRAGAGDGTSASNALDELLRRYWPALKAHLILARRIHPDEAEDLVQGFITSKILEKNLIGRADRQRGRFRALLITALDRYVISVRRAASAKRRSGGRPAADPGLLEKCPAPERADYPEFDTAWAREVLKQTLAAMEADCRLSGRQDVWGVFESRILRPILGEGPPVDYGELVKAFDFSSPTQAANALVTAKRLFQRKLRSVIQVYAQTGTEVDEEIQDLWRALAAGGAES